ncbi:MAG: hypothetical protein Q9215_004553 [Flavoplaca cf. flavocitrina]
MPLSNEVTGINVVLVQVAKVFKERASSVDADQRQEMKKTVVPRLRDMHRIRLDLESLSALVPQPSKEATDQTQGMREEVMLNLAKHHNGVQSSISHVYDKVDQHIAKVEEMIQQQGHQLQIQQTMQIGPYLRPRLAGRRLPSSDSAYRLNALQPSRSEGVRIRLNHYNSSQLTWPAARRSDHGVALPLGAGADPNLMDVQFTSAVSYAAERDHTVCVRLLLDDPDPPIPEGRPTTKSSSSCWTDGSSTANAPRLKGTHLLQIAAMYADIETIQILKSTDHFALSYDRSYIAADFTTLLHKRWDANEKLVTAFEELIRLIDRQPPDDEVDRLASSARSNKRTLNKRVNRLNLIESGLLECTHGSSEDATLASDVHDKDDDSSEQSFDDAPDKP